MALFILTGGDSLAGHGYLGRNLKTAMKTSFLAIAAIALISAPAAAEVEDRAQLVLISGINADKRLGGSDALNKVTFTVPTLRGCKIAGEEWVSEKEVGHRLGWRKFQCFERF